MTTPAAVNEGNVPWHYWSSWKIFYKWNSVSCALGCQLIRSLVYHRGMGDTCIRVSDVMSSLSEPMPILC